ncbi:hypothetical protein Tdes44962_MAKER07824 [Teratosphaeria destructans]|uniref:Uncharacterized protein n=1 Tax=Teratosphaeria destructans TaxID=418781 RepID=A0A9W7SYB8_9PEZI|nr:hypothetical protein Tdes44962_MAKER07824 [Teratosphaeria destructans]
MTSSPQSINTATTTTTTTTSPSRLNGLNSHQKTRLIQLLAWASCICRKAQAHKQAQSILAFLLHSIEYKQPFFDRVVRQARNDNPAVIEALKKCRGAESGRGEWRGVVAGLVEQAVVIVEAVGGSGDGDGNAGALRAVVGDVRSME